MGRLVFEQMHDMVAEVLGGPRRVCAAGTGQGLQCRHPRCATLRTWIQVTGVGIEEDSSSVGGFNKGEAADTANALVHQRSFPQWLLREKSLLG